MASVSMAALGGGLLTTPVSSPRTKLSGPSEPLWVHPMLPEAVNDTE